MDKRLVIAAAGLALILSATSARAGGGTNGVSLNGWNNGVSLNGWTENGWMNGLSINGFINNATPLNGFQLNATPLNGYQLNATPLNGGGAATPARPIGPTILDGFTIERVELPDHE